MSHVVGLDKCGDGTLTLLHSPCLGACDQVTRLIFHRTSAAFHKFTRIYRPTHLESAVLFEPQFVLSATDGLKGVFTIAKLVQKFKGIQTIW